MLISSPIVVKKKVIKFGIKFPLIDISVILKYLKNKFRKQNNRPPITGAGIQKLFKKLTLFFNKLPIKKKNIDSVKVCTISKLKVIKISPPL